MNELKGACIVGQSGGPTSVINASVYGVVDTALKNPNITRVLGAAHGIKGVLADQLYDMGLEDPTELELLKYTPSSALGSCRYKMADPDVDDTDYKRILEIFKKYDVRYFFYNGGNDSMTGRENDYTWIGPYVDNSIVFVVMRSREMRPESSKIPPEKWPQSESRHPEPLQRFPAYSPNFPGTSYTRSLLVSVYSGSAWPGAKKSRRKSGGSRIIYRCSHSFRDFSSP